MPNGTNPSIEDALILFDRFRRHFGELKQILNPERGSLWKLSIERRGDALSNQLHLDRHRLRQARPILADAANNLIHSLDVLLGSLARHRGHRNPYQYFPVCREPDEFAASMEKWTKFIGRNAAEALKARHALLSSNIPHLQTIKRVSNSSKHWELLATGASAHAVQVHLKSGSTRMFQIPSDAFSVHDSYEFHVGEEDFRQCTRQILVGLSIAGLPDGLPISPETCLDCASRYVEGMIEAVESAPPERA